MSDIKPEDNLVIAEIENQRRTHLLFLALRKHHPHYETSVGQIVVPEEVVTISWREVERQKREAILKALAEAKRKTDSLMTELYEIQPVTPMMKEILRETCLHFGVPKLGVLSPRRDRKIKVPRFVACYIAKTDTKLSFPAIGRAMGNRDHTTIMNACQQIELMIAEGSPVIADIDAIRIKVFAAVEARVRTKNEIHSDLRDCSSNASIAAASQDCAPPGTGSERAPAFGTTQ